MARHLADIFFAVLLLLGSLYLWLAADAFPRFARYEGIDSDFWPKVLMVMIAMLSAILLYQNVQKLRLYRKVRAPNRISEEGDLDWRKLIFAAALTIIYVVSLRYLGFLISTFFFIMVAQNIVSYRNRIAKVVFPFAFTAIMSVIFIKVMSIRSEERRVGKE